MELKNFSFAMKYAVDETFDSERFTKLRVYIMHNGKNPNFSHFSDEAIENAKPTLANIPILAHVIEDKDGNLDFGGHDFVIEEDKMNEGEYRIIYKEIPIGVIPETNNYAIEEIDGRNYVVADCFIWNEYAGYGVDIIKNQETVKVSMEVIANDYQMLEDDKNYFDITEYKYSAVTMLNSSYGTGMIGAKAELQTFNLDENREKFLEFTSELNKILNPEFVEEEKLEEDPDPETIEPEEDMGCGDKEKFEMTTSAKLDKLQDNMEDEWIYAPDGALVSGKSYYVFDMMGDYVLASMWSYDSDWTSDHKYIKAKFDDETLVIDMSSVVEVFSTWLTKEEMDAVDAAKVQADFAYAEAQKQIETLSNENALLSEFKKTVETEQFKAEVDEKLAEFEDEIGNADEFKSLKETAYSMTLDSVEKECFAIVGRFKHTPKAPTAKKAKPVSFVGVDNKQTKGSGKYGEFEKYFDK